MKRILIIVIAVIVLVVIALYWHARPSHVHAEKIMVQKGRIREKVTAVGNIIPAQSVTIKSVISGTVQQLFHREGEFVAADEPLLAVKLQMTPQEYADLQQQIKIDLSKVQQFEKTLNRHQSLLKLGAISENDQDFRNAEANLNQIRLQYNLDKEKLALRDKGKANINGKQINNTVVSPLAGYILQRKVEVGDPVVGQSGALTGNPLFVIADMDHLIFKGIVNETDTNKINKLMSAEIKIAAMPNQLLKGKVKSLALQALSKTGGADGGQTDAAKIDTVNPFNVGFEIVIDDLQIPEKVNLRAGYSATADMIVADKTDVIIVPARMLQFEGEKAFVMIAKNEQKSEKRYIEYGISDGMNIEITQGLKVGDVLLPPSAADNNV